MPSGLAPSGTPAFDEPAAAQFGFWCGDWCAESIVGGGEEPKTGHNSVGWLWDGKALLEQFSMPDGSDVFHGHSISVPVQGRGWCQTWVDSEGQYLDFVGGMVGDEMVLDRTAVTAEGRTVLQRMRWWDIDSDAFSWDWLAAEPGADEWDLRWRLRYTRA